MSNVILFEQQGSIGTLTFNRPEVFNAMNDEVILRLRDLTTELRQSTSLRALIVRGAGKAFIAGGDVGLFYQRLDTMAEGVKPLGDALHEGIINIRNLPFPIIAQIQGAVAGAGLSLMLACDFAVAAEGAQFNSAYSRIGLSPDGGSTYFLPRIVGLRKAAEIIMLADMLDAKQALEYGLINRVVTPDQLEATVNTLAERLANGPTQAYARAKRLLNQSFETPIQPHLDDEIACFAECARTQDFREGVTAFVQKRKPGFTGH
ncbi:MAG: enoyl-CoA hydratase/isomerase family protein [Betaproteobacteria bacterium]|nr:enoyl-CoA hydratase/isomerase family protein [Betaproteobacteria bacterium]